MPLPSRAQAPEPVAVVLDLVKPFWACRDLGCVGRQAELERLEHALKIGIWTANCQSAGVVVDEVRDRHRRLATISTRLGQLCGDVVGHVA